MESAGMDAPRWMGEAGDGVAPVAALGEKLSSKRGAAEALSAMRAAVLDEEPEARPDRIADRKEGAP